VHYIKLVILLMDSVHVDNITQEDSAVNVREVSIDSLNVKVCNEYIIHNFDIMCNCLIA